MKILMISADGDGLGLANHLAKLGHEVRVFFSRGGMTRLALKNIIQHSDSWRPDAADWANLVMSDMVGFSRHEKAIKAFNVPHLGFNSLADMAELDREKQIDLLDKSGISIPTTIPFDSPGDAIDWIPNLPEAFVIKPSGNIDTGKTMVIKDKELAEWALKQYDKEQELIIQTFIDGIEISTEGWFSANDWVPPFNHTMEEKRFMNGNLGPNTGCMGNVVWPIKGENAFVKELKKLTPWLSKIDYRGPVDMNCIANRKGIYALELTMRFGYDAVEALSFLAEDDFGEFLMGIAMGTGDALKLRYEYSTAVRLSVPPYPHGEPEENFDAPILGIEDMNMHQYLTDVYLKDGKYFWSGVDGVLMKIVDSNKNLGKSIKGAYAEVEKISAPGLQYRTDIGSRVEGETKILRSWGYL